MTTNQPHPLSYYLAQAYPYTVVPDDGSFFIEFPDLPGCMTQVEDPAEIADMAEEIRALWIEAEYERGAEIPAPTENESFSGKFLVRVPKSLHRDLVRAAGRESISLNTYVTMLLAQRSSLHDLAEDLMARFAEPPNGDAQANGRGPKRQSHKDGIRTRTHSEKTAAD